MPFPSGRVAKGRRNWDSGLLGSGAFAVPPIRVQIWKKNRQLSVGGAVIFFGLPIKIVWHRCFARQKRQEEGSV